MSQYLEVKTNIPETIIFKYDSFKKWDNVSKQTGKPYTSYSIAVEHNGVEKYFSLYDNEYNQAFAGLDGKLKGLMVEVAKVEDGKYKKWIVKQNGQDITSPVSSQEAQGGAYQPQVVQKSHNHIYYQTMSDFEVKALAELNRLANGYEKLFNKLELIQIGLGENLNKNAMAIHEEDNQLENLQKVGLEPESLKDIPVIEDVNSSSVPF